MQGLGRNVDALDSLLSNRCVVNFDDSQLRAGKINNSLAEIVSSVKDIPKNLLLMDVRRERLCTILRLQPTRGKN